MLARLTSYCRINTVETFGVAPIRPWAVPALPVGNYLRRMYLRFAEVELRCVVEAIAWYVQVLKSPDAPCL